METSYHIYTAKRKVLWTIKEKLDELGDFKYFDILVFKNKSSHEAQRPSSYDELLTLLKDCDSVYSFYQVETIKHGAVAYDIIINE